MTQIESLAVRVVAEERFEEFFARSYRQLAQAMLLMTGDRAEGEVWPRKQWHVSTSDGAASAAWLRRRVTSAAKVDLLRVFNALRPGHREVLVLMDWLGLNAEEAGNVLGLSPASARSRLHRARAAVRRLMGGQDD